MNSNSAICLNVQNMRWLSELDCVLMLLLMHAHAANAYPRLMCAVWKGLLTNIAHQV